MKTKSFLCTLISCLITLSTVTDATIRRVPTQYATIQSAISACSNGDSVFVAAGIYTENINLQGKQILLRATGKPGEVTIDGNHSASTVQFISGEGNLTILDGFKIINGENSYGGGIYCSGSSPTIRNCIITGNHGFYHGGVGLFSGSSAKILNCIIYENTAVQSAVGIDNSSPDVVNCTIVANSGSGVFCWNASNPIIANNILAYNGGYGVYRHDAANPTLRKNNVYADTAGLYYNVAAGADDFSSDPLFVSASQANFHLRASSPCISVGLNFYAPPYDAEGHIRPLGDWFDIGAIEEYDGGTVVSVQEENSYSPPRDFTVSPNYPNPFNPTTFIEYSLPRESNVSVKVFDAKGALVKTLLFERQVAGIHRTLWDATNASGSLVSSGTYFYTVEVDNSQQARKMIFLK
ncbi:MAG: right-handed parallel beta-helix repeat-containing protein [Bacteroidota bacterium]|nr:right-handed parallel beta-helix repeat-containing protein [Bacteroidota bacterium]